MTPLSFTVYGVPIPKGSAKGFLHRTTGRVIVTHDNKRTKPWQQAIVDAAREVLDGRPPLEDVAIAVAVVFFMARPKSWPARVVEHLVKPDNDKLLRTVKDGLTRAGVYRDDAQVVLTVARKTLAGGAGDPLAEAGVPRAVIEVGPYRDARLAFEWDQASPPLITTSVATQRALEL